VSREYVYRLKAIYDDGGAGIPGFMLGDSSRVLMFRMTDLNAYKRAHPELGRGRTQPDPEPGEDDEEAGEADGEGEDAVPASA